MLQFNPTFCTSRLKLFPYWRVRSLLSTNVVNPEISNEPKENNATITQDHEDLSTANKILQNEKLLEKKLLEVPQPIKQFQHKMNSETYFQDKIRNASTTKDLINIIKSPGITLDQVKQIISLISNQNINAKLSNVTTTEKKDSSKTPSKKSVETNTSKILPIATPSLIQVLKKLSSTKDRNIPMLKTLTYNITMYSEQLNIRMCGDILYSLSALNYFDENLLNKVMLDLPQEISNNKKSPIFGSIVTSIGLLRYKNDEVLDVICKWVVDNFETLRIQDFIATLQCFATFGYNPQHMSNLQQYISSVKKEDVKENELWLDYVWSLTILGQAQPVHISYVLSENFVKNILNIPEEKQVPKILKLLNINGAAQVLIKNYNGQLLSKSLPILYKPIERRKQKQELVELLNETLKEIAPFSFKTNVDTGMGFYIDAECYLNSRNEFVRIEDYSKNSNNTRLAIMVHDYHDYSRGKEELLGKTQFYNNILIATGYKVLNISYHNFSISDKLIKRVKYLNEQIKSI